MAVYQSPAANGGGGGGGGGGGSPSPSIGRQSYSSNSYRQSQQYVPQRAGGPGGTGGYPQQQSSSAPSQQQAFPTTTPPATSPRPSSSLGNNAQPTSDPNAHRRTQSMRPFSAFQPLDDPNFQTGGSASPAASYGASSARDSGLVRSPSPQGSIAQSFRTQPPPLTFKSPDLRNALALHDAQHRKIYMEGYLSRRDECAADGRPLHPNDDKRRWHLCFVQLSGTVLSVWSVAQMDKAAKEGREVPPTYINITDSFVDYVGTLNEDPAQIAGSRGRYENVFALNSAGANRIYFCVEGSVGRRLVQAWVNAIRLASWEKVRLEEIYTGALIRARLGAMSSVGPDSATTSTSSDPDQVTIKSPLSKGKMEGWVKVRFMGSTEWKSCWLVLTDSRPAALGALLTPTTTTSGDNESTTGGKKKFWKMGGAGDRSSILGSAGASLGLGSGQSNLDPSIPVPPELEMPPGANNSTGTALFYESKKAKRPFAALVHAAHTFAVYPTRPELVEGSTLCKVEGAFCFAQPNIAAAPFSATGRRRSTGWAMLMPEAEGGNAMSGKGANAEMMKWVIAFMDCFGLYGRPAAFTWDARNPISSFFAYPIGPYKDRLFLDRELAEFLDVREDRHLAHRTNLHGIMAARMRGERTPILPPLPVPKNMPAPPANAAKDPTAPPPANGAKDAASSLPPLNFDSSSSDGNAESYLRQPNRPEGTGNTLRPGNSLDPIGERSRESSTMTGMTNLTLHAMDASDTSASAASKSTAGSTRVPSTGAPGHAPNGSTLSDGSAYDPAQKPSIAHIVTGAPTDLRSPPSGVPPHLARTHSPASSTDSSFVGGVAPLSTRSSNADVRTAAPPPALSGKTSSRSIKGSYVSHGPDASLSGLSIISDPRQLTPKQGGNKALPEVDTPPANGTNVRTSSSTRRSPSTTSRGLPPSSNREKELPAPALEPDAYDESALAFMQNLQDEPGAARNSSKRSAKGTVPAAVARVREASEQETRGGVSPASIISQSEYGPTPTTSYGPTPTSALPPTAPLSLGATATPTSGPSSVTAAKASPVADASYDEDALAAYQFLDREPGGSPVLSNKGSSRSRDVTPAATHAKAQSSTEYTTADQPDSVQEGLSAMAQKPAFPSSFGGAKSKIAERKTAAQIQAAKREEALSRPGGGKRRERSMGRVPGTGHAWGGESSEEESGEEDSDKDEEEEEAERKKKEAAGSANASGAATPNEGAVTGDSLQQQALQRDQHAAVAQQQLVQQQQQLQQQVFQQQQQQQQQYTSLMQSGASSADWDAYRQQVQLQQQQLQQAQAQLNAQAAQLQAQAQAYAMAQYQQSGTQEAQARAYGAPPPLQQRGSLFNSHLDAAHSGDDVAYADQRPGHARGLSNASGRDGTPPPQGPQRTTFVQLSKDETPGQMTAVFQPHGLLQAGAQEKAERSAKAQEAEARSGGGHLVSVPNKPPPPQAGLLGAITAHERDRKGAGGFGATLTERERARVDAERRGREDEASALSQQQQMMAMQQQYAMMGFNPYMWQQQQQQQQMMMMGMMPGMPGMDPHMAQQQQAAMLAAQQAYSQAMSQIGGGGGTPSMMGGSPGPGGAGSPSGRAGMASPLPGAMDPRMSFYGMPAGSMMGVPPPSMMGVPPMSMMGGIPGMGAMSGMGGPGSVLGASSPYMTASPAPGSPYGTAGRSSGLPGAGGEFAPPNPAFAQGGSGRSSPRGGSSPKQSPGVRSSMLPGSRPARSRESSAY